MAGYSYAKIDCEEISLYFNQINWSEVANLDIQNWPTLTLRVK